MTERGVPTYAPQRQAVTLEQAMLVATEGSISQEIHVYKDARMSVLKIEHPTHIQLPKEVGERLGLKQEDVILITIEAQCVILEKRTSSPVDASFGLWADLPPGAAYVAILRDEWDECLTERLSDA
jgi:bifunctional DNA-binding transcriptional regulator/antitoxin component of YhaV-PrlF toxin-antitoxin module